MPEPDYYEQDAEFSACKTYRYSLTRAWFGVPGTPEKTMVFCGVNPSTADENVLDPTLRRCVSFARREGCTKLVVVNLFALRSTDPLALYSHPCPEGPENTPAIVLAAIDARPGGIFLAGWGCHGEHLGQGRKVASLLTGRGVSMWCLGRTTAGHPRHPLYLRSDAAITPWDGYP
jgi:hypothetical protein